MSVENAASPRGRGAVSDSSDYFDITLIFRIDDTEEDEFWYPMPDRDGSWSYPSPEVEEGEIVEDNRTDSWEDLAVSETASEGAVE